MSWHTAEKDAVPATKSGKHKGLLKSKNVISKNIKKTVKNEFQ